MPVTLAVVEFLVKEFFKGHFKTFLSFFCSIFISVYRLSCDVGNVSFIPIAFAALSHTQSQMLKVKLDKKHVRPGDTATQSMHDLCTE